MSSFPPTPDLTGGAPAPEQSTSILNSDLYSSYANSYIDNAYAQAYFSSHFKTAYAAQWAALSTSQQDQLLVQACADIEQFRFVEQTEVPHYHFYVDPSKHLLLAWQPRNLPIKYDFYQSLQFPRNCDQKADGTIFIPPHIQMAQCEQAIYRLNFDETQLSNALQGLQLNNVKVNGISVYQHVTPGGVNIAPSAYAWIKPYLKRGRRIVRA